MHICAHTCIYTHETIGNEYKPEAMPETAILNSCFIIKFDLAFHKIKFPLGENPWLLVLWVCSVPVSASYSINSYLSTLCMNRMNLGCYIDENKETMKNFALYLQVSS